MEIIVDIQGFQAINYSIIPKEIAILSRDSSRVQHFLIKPPYPWKNLSKQHKRSAIWLYHNHHGLRWDDGNINYEEMFEILKNIMNQSVKIYVKGAIKKEFLDQFSIPCCEIIDIDTFDVNKSFKMCLTHRACFHHTQKYVCALSNVYKIKKMFDDDHDIMYDIF